MADQIMPVFFIGHGSPMNALELNPFTEALKNMRPLCPNPKAILCISAHWMTEGTWVTQMKNPKTIHDFYGFPQELFDIQYPAPGNPEIAQAIRDNVDPPHIQGDHEMWGLDHGAWSVLRHIFPEARVPVIQLSLNITKDPLFHFELGKKLQVLRESGILIVASGNIVHNLRKIKWESDAPPYDWALEFDDWIKAHLQNKNFDPLIHDFLKSESGKLSVPTMEHYYPLLYALGAAAKDDQIHFDFEGIQNASISMRTFSLRPR